MRLLGFVTRRKEVILKMSYTIKIEVKEDHIFAIVDGDASLGSAIEMWDSLRVKSEELGLRKILVLYNVSGQLKTIDTFAIGKHIAKTYLLGPKIAFVDNRPDYAEQHLFGENVLSNRSAIGKAFQDISLAAKWLEVG